MDEQACANLRQRYLSLQQDRLKLETGLVKTGFAGLLMTRLTELENELDPDTVALRDRYAKKHNALFVSAFKNDVASVQVGDSEWILISRNGQRVGEGLYSQNPQTSSTDKVMVAREDADIFYLINFEGERVSANFLRIGQFSEGLAEVRLANEYTYIDEQGDLLSFRYPLVYEFSEGLALAFDRDQSFFIDKHGEIRFRLQSLPTARDIGAFHDGQVRVDFSDNLKNRIYFFSKEGNREIRDEYDYAGDFSEGLAIVKKGANGFVIDTTGKVIADLGVIYGAQEFKEGKAFVYTDDHTGHFIDRSGNRLFGQARIFSSFHGFFEGLASCYDKENGHHFINDKGEVVLKTGGKVGLFTKGVADLGNNYYIDKKGRRVFGYGK